MSWSGARSMRLPTRPTRPRCSRRSRSTTRAAGRAAMMRATGVGSRTSAASYDGPALPLLVAACRAPDGTYWALQIWQRKLPMRGFAPWTARQRENEVHVSHWSGALPLLEVYRHWTYGHTKQGFFGRLTYGDEPVYGTRSPSARISDRWARNIYIDTFNSDYGKGWRHDTAITTHTRSGGFCYTFVAQPSTSGLPERQAERDRAREEVPHHRDGPGRDPNRALGRHAAGELRSRVAVRRGEQVRADPRRRQALRTRATRVSHRPAQRRLARGGALEWAGTLRR